MDIALVLAIVVIMILMVLGAFIQESDTEVAVKRCKTLESRLKQEQNATGNGLVELAKSVKPPLPKETLQQVQDIADMRNPIVHEEHHDKLSNRKLYIQLCDSVESKLDELRPPRQASNNYLGCLAFFSSIVIIIYFLSQNLP